MGGRAIADGGQGLASSRPEGARDVLGRVRLAVRLSLAAARSRSDRDRLRGIGAALEADPRRLRRGRRRRRLCDPSRRGHFRRRDLRALPRRAEGPQALRHPLRPLAFRCCSSSTISPSSTSTTSASRRFTSRTPSSIRPGARASIPATRRGSSGPDASARSATGRSISAAFSPSSRNTAIPPGRCSNGNAASSIPRTARARAPSSSDGTSSASTEKAFDDFAGGAIDKKRIKRALGLR